MENISEQQREAEEAEQSEWLIAQQASDTASSTIMATTTTTTANATTSSGATGGAAADIPAVPRPGETTVTLTAIDSTPTPTNSSTICRATVTAAIADRHGRVTTVIVTLNFEEPPAFPREWWESISTTYVLLPGFVWQYSLPLAEYWSAKPIDRSSLYFYLWVTGMVIFIAIAGSMLVLHMRRIYRKMRAFRAHAQEPVQVVQVTIEILQPQEHHHADAAPAAGYAIADHLPLPPPPAAAAIQLAPINGTPGGFIQHTATVTPASGG